MVSRGFGLGGGLYNASWEVWVRVWSISGGVTFLILIVRVSRVAVLSNDAVNGGEFSGTLLRVFPWLEFSAHDLTLVPTKLTLFLYHDSDGRG